MPQSSLPIGPVLSYPHSQDSQTDRHNRGFKDKHPFLRGAKITLLIFSGAFAALIAWATDGGYSRQDHSGFVTALIYAAFESMAVVGAFVMVTIIRVFMKGASMSERHYAGKPYPVQLKTFAIAVLAMVVINATLGLVSSVDIFHLGILVRHLIGLF